MRRREYHWSLFHTVEKNQLDSLRTDQVEAIFAAIPKAQRREWHIWKEGFDGWKPFDEFPELVKSLRSADDRVVEPPPPFPIESAGTMTGTQSLGAIDADIDHAARPVEKPAAKQAAAPASAKPLSARAHAAPKAASGPTSKLVLEDEEQDGGLELSLVRSGVLEDRNNMRFDKAFELRIFINDDVFPNVTQNISLRGMQVRDPLPRGLPRYFNVEIGKKGERSIPVVCSEVKPKDGGASTRLKIESNEHASALLTMLLSGS